MAQAKINGSTDWPMTSDKPNFTSDESGGIPATLVIHDDKIERVFTESEVKKVLEEFATISDLAKAIRRLSDDQRLELFRDYCKYCGRYDADSLSGCQCWNDE